MSNGFEFLQKAVGFPRPFFGEVLVASAFGSEAQARRELASDVSFSAPGNGSTRSPDKSGSE